MKIYLQMPSIAVLGQWALERFTDAGTITVCPATGPTQDFTADPKARPQGVPYSFAPDYLWELMKQDQANLSLTEQAQAEYVRG